MYMFFSLSFNKLISQKANYFQYLIYLRREFDHPSSQVQVLDNIPKI